MKDHLDKGIEEHISLHGAPLWKLERSDTARTPPCRCAGAAFNHRESLTKIGSEPLLLQNSAWRTTARVQIKVWAEFGTTALPS